MDRAFVIDGVCVNKFTRPVLKEEGTLKYSVHYLLFEEIQRFVGHRDEVRADHYDLGNYENRIFELVEVGEEEDIGLNETSVSDFGKFLRYSNDLKECGLTLTDAGNLSALWVRKSAYRVSVRFFGTDAVQYAFITYETPEKAVVDSGKCSVSELVARVQNFGLLFE